MAHPLAAKGLFGQRQHPCIPDQMIPSFGGSNRQKSVLADCEVPPARVAIG